MKVNTIENILNSMLETLDEFKSEDIKYYRKQALRIIKHIKNLEKEIFDDYKKARHRQYELNANYHDTILLSEQDLLELKLHMNHNVSKTV